ncbi:MAG: hypothetical protein HND56_02885 [Pseudomonadota bacterium]|nr:hypothetical protein [Pseudomonadota bacterium]QKK04697.1 MAG: hypothetical protein HND56_02885 [Pseudomonadota bacterium]
MEIAGKIVCDIIDSNIVFGIVAVVFSFLAYRHTKERFRLDLLDKRWEVYEKVLEFCSRVTQYGGLPKHCDDDEERNKSILAALMASESSFRGIGYHKARSLFGTDIHGKLDKLDKAYSFFITYQDNSHDKHDQQRAHLSFVWETVNDLPEIFKPYIYFGDFKQRSVRNAILSFTLGLIGIALLIVGIYVGIHAISFIIY